MMGAESRKLEIDATFAQLLRYCGMSDNSSSIQPEQSGQQVMFGGRGAGLRDGALPKGKTDDEIYCSIIDCCGPCFVGLQHGRRNRPGRPKRWRDRRRGCRVIEPGTA
jgi:hypothetical protein